MGGRRSLRLFHKKIGVGIHEPIPRRQGRLGVGRQHADLLRQRQSRPHRPLHGRQGQYAVDRLFEHDSPFQFVHRDVPDNETRQKRVAIRPQNSKARGMLAGDQTATRRIGMRRGLFC